MEKTKSAAFSSWRRRSSGWESGRRRQWPSGRRSFWSRRCRRWGRWCSFCRRRSSGSGWRSAPGASCWASGWVRCPVPCWRWRRKKWEWVDALLAPVMQLVKATPGGQLHHSGAGVGQRLVPVGPHQLPDGAARPLRRGAHRHRERRPPASRDGAGVPPAAGAASAGRLAPGGAACVPAGVQCGAGHLLEERRGGGGHRPARRQHRRRPLSGEDHPLYRGAVRMDFRYHPVERGI